MATHASTVRSPLLSCISIIGLSFAVGLIASAAAAGAQTRAQDDAFVEQHRTAVAANSAGVRFSARLVDDKGWFYQGELIPIELLYESLDGGWHGLNDCGPTLRCHSIAVVLERTDGVTPWPGRDLNYSNLHDFIPEGAPGCLPPGDVSNPFNLPVKLPPPRRLPVILNEN